MNYNKHVLKILAITVSVAFFGYLLDSLIHDSKTLEHSLDIIAEFFTVFVSFSIFVITWYSYNKSRDNHALFIGVAFAIIGFTDLLHILSYDFMPDFITPNTQHKSGFFWIFARVISSASFLLSAYIFRNTLPEIINKKVLSTAASVSFLVLSVAGVYYHDYMPGELYGEELSFLRIVYWLITAIIIIYASHLYTKRLTEHWNEIFLIYGFVLLYFSDVLYFTYDLGAHFLKAIGFYYVFVSMYKSSVELPYERMSVIEEKLRHSAESKYKSVFDYANDAIITIDTYDNITSWNHSAELMFGWQAEEIIGKQLPLLIVPDSLMEERKRILKQVNSGAKLVGFETVRMHRDGTLIDVELTGSIIRDANKEITGFSIIIRDITEYKKYETSLKKSKEFVETVLNSMNDAISIIDVNNFRIIDVNQVFLDTYGLEKEQVIGKTCYKISHNRDVPCLSPDEVCPLKKTLDSGTYSVTEHVHYVKGEIQYVEVSASPIFDENRKVIQVVHVSRDISERKIVETALRESEEKFRTMVEHSNDLIWTLDNEGKFTYFNKIAEEITGYKLDDWVGKSFVPLINPDDLKKVGEVFIETLKGKSQQYEVIIFGKSGNEITLSVNTAPLFEKGSVIGTVSFGRDVTELIKIEELRLENLRLSLADKAKSEFLSTMSHELRTPLNASLGFSELLKTGKAGDLNEEQKTFVENILKSNKHLLRLINDILDLSRIEAGKLKIDIEKVSVPEIIDEAVSIINVVASKRNVVIIKEIDPQLDFIYADKQRIKQVLFNFLGNAVKFSKDTGGTVTVTAWKEGEMARISVSDTGIGIKKTDLGRVFKEFEQLDAGITRKYGGSGLGLAISKKLVELQGGTITVESKYGVGSTFTFSIPIRAEKDTEK